MDNLFWPHVPMERAGTFYARASEVTKNRNHTDRVGRAVEQLEQRIDRLSLVNEALWTLLRERVGVTDAELLERIREVDLSDGRLDGKVRRKPVDCPGCKRTVSNRHDRCLYCGQDIERGPFDAP